jgi:hypothetical protein
MRNVVTTIVELAVTRAAWWLLGAAATLALLWMLSSAGGTDGPVQ